MSDIKQLSYRCPICSHKVVVYADHADVWCATKHPKPVRMELTRSAKKATSSAI